MKTKKIIAESMPLALKMVRQELGDNAIIVNTRAVKTGGVFGLFAKQKYEVTAYSMDREAPAASQANKDVYHSQLHPSPRMAPEPALNAEEPRILPKKAEMQYKAFSHSVPEKESAPVQAAQAREEFSAPLKENEDKLLEELQDMRKMMMAMLMDRKNESTLPPGLSELITRLKKQGVEEEVIEHLVSRLLKKLEAAPTSDPAVVKQMVASIILDIIEKRIPQSNAIGLETRMINVVGPTGVGKTTSIAKLATEQVLRQKRRVAMITTDVYRIGAVEQLKTYAGILNVPIEVVRSADELGAALEKLNHYDLIYMDTTGRNYKELVNRQAINQFLNHPSESENYLVLSLTTKYEDMDVILAEFMDSPVNKLILTKADETTSYGSILNIAFKYSYQLAYIANGQSVPEDITAINAEMVACYLLGEERENGSSTKSQRIYGSI